MIDPIPLIVWVATLAFCLHWLFNAIKMKVNYEITAALGILFYFTAAFIGQYFTPLFEHLITIIIGITLVILGFFIFISQIMIMKRLGQGENWENTTAIIEKGWFKYMRHPIYFGCALADIGIIIWIPSIFSIIMALISLILCFLSSHWEDKTNIEKFGIIYKEYMKGVKLWGII
jgi:protein-S-isoprenylcysteine O-methyltransferase Ste14